MPKQPAPCCVCGVPDAGFGFGFPGHRRKLPKNMQGRIWVCRDHIEVARERMMRAISAPQIEPAATDPAPADPPRQPSLF